MALDKVENDESKITKLAGALKSDSAKEFFRSVEGNEDFALVQVPDYLDEAGKLLDTEEIPVEEWVTLCEILRIKGNIADVLTEEEEDEEEAASGF